MNAFFENQDIALSDLAEICSRDPQPAECPTADAIEQKIPVYCGDTVRAELSDPSKAQAVRSEWSLVLRDGPGIIAIRGAYDDPSVVDRSTRLFEEIVVEEKEAGLGGADHFGSNERIWNSLQKVCLKDPDLFIDYYGNRILAAVCLSWLGPGYQVTAQMNTVKPGSDAQSVHRDYHLGIQTPDTVVRYPAHAQTASQYLTLQGAVAHTDMPQKSGPTLLLPYSHHYAPGYLATPRPEFQAYFNQNAAQLPLSKGDAIFFSPAVFHAAGRNTQTTNRIANLLQISSAFGRTMESLDTRRMSIALYPSLLERYQSGQLDEDDLQSVVAVAADGYAFPTNLDTDPPIDGNAPETAQMLMKRAIVAGWNPERLGKEIDALSTRRQA